LYSYVNLPVGFHNGALEQMDMMRNRSGYILSKVYRRTIDGECKRQGHAWGGSGAGLGKVRRRSIGCSCSTLSKWWYWGCISATAIMNPKAFYL
jgi:hypothetical protein